MRSENRKIEGNFNLEYDLELHGMVTGTITVLPGITLYLHGVCEKNLIVEDDATVYVHGTVGGNLENHGGLVKVFGTVIGHIIDFSGSTIIDKNAIINNKN